MAVGRLMDCQVFDASNRPNHCLLNHYLPGEGILAHQDGPAYHPLVAIVSLGASTMMHFYRSVAAAKRGESEAGSAEFSMCLQPRSLLVFCQAVYTELFHAIHEVLVQCPPVSVCV